MAKVALNPEFAEKITNLRTALGISKAAFSRALGVSSPQLLRWEKGEENPSNQKLILLGNMANEALPQRGDVPPSKKSKSPEDMKRLAAINKLSICHDNYWFWEQAGLNLDVVWAALSQTRVGLGSSADADVVRIPRLNSAALLKFVKYGAVDANSFATERVPFSVLFVSDPASTICVQATDRLAGSTVFAGDLSLIRLVAKKRGTTEANDLPDLSFENLIGCSVAAFYESLPMTRELSPEMMRRGRPPARLFTDRDRRILELNEALLRERDPVAAAEQDKKDEKLGDKAFADATAPGVLFGTLWVQSDENWDGDFNHFKGDHPWRLVLDCGATWNGLTSWSTEPFPWDGTLRHRLIPELHVHILGSVIGWLRAPGTTGGAV